MIAIGSEVCGKYVGEINISEGLENAGERLRFGWKHQRFNLTGKSVQDWRWRWDMVPGIGVRLKCLWSD